MADAPPGDARIVPRGQGAASYGASRPAGPPDPLQSAIVEDARRIAAAAGLPVPGGDARLDAVMEDLARGIRGDDLPAFEVIDFLLGHYGIVEPAPHLLLASTSLGGEAGLRETVAAQLPAALRSAPVSRVGVGVDRSGPNLFVVVGLQEQNVELRPIQRGLPAGGAAPIAGRLLGGHREPHVIVTAPDGSVHDLEARGDAAAFSAAFRCDRGDGRYQVEVTGADKLGSAVLANFPVFCGVAPPAEAPRGTIVKQGSLDPAVAERLMLDLVNKDRAAARLPPLVWDDGLGAVARAHSHDMSDHDFVGHVSPRTGHAMDRARRAGLVPNLVLENVGRAYSIEEAERGFMLSPGHRANILDKRVTRLGVGVAIGKPVTGTRPFFITQLYRD